jgi:hypothetical protein
MSNQDDCGEDGVLFPDGLTFFLDHDLQVTDNGSLYLQTTLEIGDLEKVVINKPFWEITQFLIDHAEDDYQELYAIANELIREADRLKDLAQTIEDSDHTVADLFDTDYDPTA